MKAMPIYTRTLRNTPPETLDFLIEDGEVEVGDKFIVQERQPYDSGNPSSYLLLDHIPRNYDGREVISGYTKVLYGNERALGYWTVIGAEDTDAGLMVTFQNPGNQPRSTVFAKPTSSAPEPLNGSEATLSPALEAALVEIRTACENAHPSHDTRYSLGHTIPDVLDRLHPRDRAGVETPAFRNALRALINAMDSEDGETFDFYDLPRLLAITRHAPYALRFEAQDQDRVERLTGRDAEALVEATICTSDEDELEPGYWALTTDGRAGHYSPSMCFEEEQPAHLEIVNDDGTFRAVVEMVRDTFAKTYAD